MRFFEKLNNNNQMADKDWDFAYANLGKLDLDSLKLFFDQAEKQLAVMTNIAESFRTRAIGILAFVVTFIFTILAFGAQHLSQIYLIFPLSCAVITLSLAALCCMRIIMARASGFVGCKPSLLMNESAIKEWIKHRNTKQQKVIILIQCRSYQKKIDQRATENKRVGRLFNCCIWLLILTPAIAAVTFVPVYIYSISYLWILALLVQCAF